MEMKPRVAAKMKKVTRRSWVAESGKLWVKEGLGFSISMDCMEKYVFILIIKIK